MPFEKHEPLLEVKPTTTLADLKVGGVAIVRDVPADGNPELKNAVLLKTDGASARSLTGPMYHFAPWSKIWEWELEELPVGTQVILTVV